jgi:hypothetical protein
VALAIRICILQFRDVSVLVLCRSGRAARNPTGFKKMLGFASLYPTDQLIMKTKKIPPIHPGEILLEDFLEPMGISQYKLSEHSGESDPGFRSYPTPRSVSKRPLH